MLSSLRGRQRPTGAEEDPAQPQLPAAPAPNPNDGAFGGPPQPPADPFPGPAPPYAAPATAPPAPSSLYGLAADLVGQGQGGAGQGAGRAGPDPGLGPGPGPGLGASRPPPARLGPPRTRLAAPGAAAVPDPFSMAEARRHPPQHLPVGHIGERPYGLALELINNQEAGASFAGPLQPPDRLGSRSSRRSALESQQPYGAARLGEPPPAAVHQPPPMDPFTVMELAASQQGLPEPDYGLVAELRNRAGPDPFASDYGLVAEVARRRGRSPSPLGRGVGVLPPVRARRRLDAVEGEGFGLAGEMAARQRQQAADMAEPFSAAARNGGQDDPFALADEQLKVPRELLNPYLESQQELPDGPVRLKTPGDDASETSAVSGDDELYGIARELGVDLETARRIQQERSRGGAPLPGQAEGEQAEPPGHKYVYDEDTGMLITTEGGQGDGGRVARQYIEDEVTGVFYKLQSTRRRLFNMLRRKEQALGDSDDEEEDKGFRGGLRRTLEGLVNVFNILGMFAQGLLGGFALLNFFMTYMLYGSTTLRKFLSYYAPIALDANRLYYTLLVLAIISSTSRLARDKLRDFQPRKLWLLAVDYGQLLLYLGAFIASVLCTPLDDEISYESDRNPRFHELTFASGFKRRFALWNTLNIFRTLFCGLAWGLTCYQTSPYVFEATLRMELRLMKRQHAMLAALGHVEAAAPHKTA